LTQVRLTIAELQNDKQVSCCNVINFENGVAIEGILCRFSGYIPPAAPARKAATQVIASHAQSMLNFVIFTVAFS
jgi:hypothetical protein